MLNVPEEVKALCRTDGVRKNFRVHFIELDLPDLTNKDIVTESVTFTESLCSRDKLKFGVCEASSLSFDAVGVPDIKDALIKCGLDIDCSSVVGDRYKIFNGSGMNYGQISEEYELDAVAGEVIRLDMSCENMSYTTPSSFRLYYADGEYIEFDTNVFGIDENGEPIKAFPKYFTVPNGKEIVSIIVTIRLEQYADPCEYSFKIERQPVFDGIEQREDLDYPTYYIPYGEFAVDSCKKDADTEKRSVMAYSYENITDFGVPESINALYWYTTAKEMTLDFTIDNLLDLTFPSYSVSRHKLIKGEIEMDESLTYELEDDCRLICQYSVARMAEPNTKTIFTYNAKFNEDKHNKMISDAIEEVKRVFGVDIPRSHFDNFIPKMENIDNAYGVMKPNARKEMTLTCANWYSTTLDWLNPSSHTVNLDGRPHTLFKIYDYVQSGSTTTLSGCQVDPIYQGEPMIDNGGYIMIPSKIIVIEPFGMFNQFRSGNEVLYYREEIGNGEPALSLTSNIQLRNVFTYNYKTKTTVGVGYRDDYTFNGEVAALDDGKWRSIIESSIELMGCIGHYNREGCFELKKIKTSDSLYPSEKLFPTETLYPKEVGGIILNRATYSKAWFDDSPTSEIREIIANFQGLEEERHLNLVIPDKIDKVQNVYDENYQVYDGNYDSGYIYGFQGTIAFCNSIRIETSVPITNLIIGIRNESTTAIDDYYYPIPEPSTSVIISGDDIIGEEIVNNASLIEQFEFTFDNPNHVDPIRMRVFTLTVDEYMPNGKHSSYDISSNYYVSNGRKTAKYVQGLMEKIAPNVVGTQYTPSNIECMGQPYIEAGDWVTVVTENNGFDSLILSRTLKGIQTLKDSYESRGE